MVNIVLLSHGPLASAMLDSLTMLYGKKDNATSFTLGALDDVEIFEEKIYQYVLDNIQNDTIFICDLAGGTPFNCATRVKSKFDNVEVIAGMNVGMILEIFLSDEHCDLKTLVEKASNAGKESVVVLNIPDTDMDELDELMG